MKGGACPSAAIRIDPGVLDDDHLASMKGGGVGDAIRHPGGVGDPVRLASMKGGTVGRRDRAVEPGAMRLAMASIKGGAVGRRDTWIDGRPLATCRRLDEGRRLVRAAMRPGGTATSPGEPGLNEGRRRWASRWLRLTALWTCGFTRLNEGRRCWASRFPPKTGHQKRERESLDEGQC
jgi:hypothetical protein